MIESIELCWNLGDNCVEIDSISPGYMDTALNRVPALDAQKKMWCSRTPMNRLGNVDELNNTAIFLASDASTFMTGSDIVVDVSLFHPAIRCPVLTDTGWLLRVVKCMCIISTVRLFTHPPILSAGNTLNFRYTMSQEHLCL